MSETGIWLDEENGMEEKEELRWTPKFMMGEPVGEEPLLSQG